MEEHVHHLARVSRARVDWGSQGTPARMILMNVQRIRISVKMVENVRISMGHICK